MKIKILLLSLSVILFSCGTNKTDNIVKNAEKFFIEQMDNPEKYNSNYVDLFDIKYKSDLIYMESIMVDDSIKYKKMMNEIYYLNENPKEDSIIKYIVEIDYSYVDSTNKKINDNRLVSYDTRNGIYYVMPK